jgi:hypothetical protein
MAKPNELELEPDIPDLLELGSKREVSAAHGLDSHSIRFRYTILARGRTRNGS